MIKFKAQILLFVFFLTALTAFSQRVQKPKNISEALVIFKLECPDSLKAKICKTPNDALFDVCYPNGGDLRLVYDWTDSLRGVYIPIDLADCFKQIDSFWSDSIQNEVKQWSEDKFTGRAHMGFGMWMRNNWQLWAGSRLSAYFNNMGIHHPDDMSGIILASYHRYLRGEPIELEAQIKMYQDYWKKASEED